MGKHLSTDMEDKTYTHQQSSNSVDRTSRTFSINNPLSSTCSNSHRQRRKSPPSDSDSDSYYVCDSTLHTTTGTHAEAKREKAIVSAALMHACKSHPPYM